MKEVDINNIISSLEEIAEQIEYLRTTTGQGGYTIADSLETIALILLQQQQEKGQ